MSYILCYYKERELVSSVNDGRRYKSRGGIVNLQGNSCQIIVSINGDRQCKVERVPSINTQGKYMSDYDSKTYTQ